MTSVLSHVAQVPAFSFYIAGYDNDDGYMINMDFTGFIQLNEGTVLADMGKTVVTNGFIYRKVQIVSENGTLYAGNATGYICLNCDEVTVDGSTRNLNIRKLN